jgi:hypothetical protein
LTPSARFANLIAGDGTENGLPAPNKEPATNQNDCLTAKAPYKFESISIQRRVMGAIETCRSAALGSHVEQCNGCGKGSSPVIAG